MDGCPKPVVLTPCGPRHHPPLPPRHRKTPALTCVRAPTLSYPPPQVLRAELDRIRMAEEAARVRAELAEQRARDATVRASDAEHQRDQRVREVTASHSIDLESAVGEARRREREQADIAARRIREEGELRVAAAQARAQHELQVCATVCVIWVCVWWVWMLLSLCSTAAVALTDALVVTADVVYLRVW